MNVFSYGERVWMYLIFDKYFYCTYLRINMSVYVNDYHMYIYMLICIYMYLRICGYLYIYTYLSMNI
jgi:hypothetical protein